MNIDQLYDWLTNCDSAQDMQMRRVTEAPMVTNGNHTLMKISPLQMTKDCKRLRWNAQLNNSLPLLKLFCVTISSLFDVNKLFYRSLSLGCSNSGLICNH